MTTVATAIPENEVAASPLRQAEEVKLNPEELIEILRSSNELVHLARALVAS